MECKDISEKLKKAREYEALHCCEITAEQRPMFHVSTPIGWMNDPNGFSLFDDKYHLFFQYYPFDTCWGPMHWGHYITEDFVRWEMKPCVLAPDMDYDKSGCFSGTAIEKNGKHLLMYTGVKEYDEQDGSHIVRQTQCIAIGDGESYSKYEHNPVITADMLPEGSSKADFRDPKIWMDEQGFWALAGSKDEQGSGQLALFYSDDALSWKFKKILDYNHNKYGEMWECPDFFSVDGRQVLIVSPQFMEADGMEMFSGNHTIYFIGEYDGDNCSWTRDEAHMMDFGMDFYAAQTLQAKDGRRIMIGWLQNWDNHLVPSDYKWSGMMTIPRELSIKDNRIIQKPVRELERYRRNEISISNYRLESGQGETIISGIKGRSVDLTVELSKCDFSEFQMMLAANEKHRTVLTYDKSKSLISVDRSQSGMKKDFIASRSMKVDEMDGKVKLQILLDRNSVELFVNDGEQVMTTLIYTPIGAEEILFSTDGNVVMNLKKYDVVVD